MKPISYLKQFSAFIHLAAQKPLNILISVSVQLIFGFGILPYLEKQINPTNKYAILDLRFGFSVNQCYTALESFGDRGRQYYLLLAGFIDMLYPLVYSIAFALTMSMFFQKAFSKNHYLQVFNILPFLIALFDYFENFGIVTLLLNYPAQLGSMCNFTSMAGLIKWGFFLFNLLLMLTGMIAWGIKNLIKAKKF